MSKLNIEIADLESILTNCRDDHTEQELADFEKDLARLNYIDREWDRVCAAKLDATGRLIGPLVIMHRLGGRVRKGFAAGTPITDIHAWFEQAFSVSVQEDLTD